MNLACLQKFSSDFVITLMPEANKTYIKQYWPLVYMALDELGLDYEEMLLMAAIMVIREVLNFLDKKKFHSDNTNAGLKGHGAVMNEHVNDVRFAVSKVKEKVDDLHDWHDKRDADGVPLWYVRLSLEGSIKDLGEKICQQIEVQTKILQHMQTMEELHRKKVEKISGE